MNIKTKYNIGQDVYLCFLEEDGLIRLAKAKIDEIAINSESISYYVSPWIGEDWGESDLIPVDNPELLIKRINELIEEEKENERNRNS